MAKAFLAELKKNGYTAGLYSNPDFLKNWFTIENLSDYDIWLAKWTTTPQKDNPPTEYGDIVCWQYTSKGSVSGINGNVDMNFGYFKTTTIPSTPVTVNPTPAPTPTNNHPVASVTATVLNVRNGPGIKYSILRTLKQGNLVDVLESYTNGWSKINIVGLVAYVNHSYLSVYKTPLVQVTQTTTLTVGSNVKVKEGAKAYDGTSLAPFVYTTQYQVIQIKGDRVVIGIGNSVTAAVNKKDLI